jgi:hypothetical protein
MKALVSFRGETYCLFGLRLCRTGFFVVLS